MKKKGVAVFAIAFPIWAALILTGCRPAAGPKASLVFFPAPPDEPRLQFLTSFSSPADLGKAQNHSWENFILGAPNESSAIGKPYGAALHKGKIYVCDLEAKKIEVLDLVSGSFADFSQNKYLKNPISIAIDAEGRKFITDSGADVVYVFDEADGPLTILGKGLDWRPLDIAVEGDRCYITDSKNQEIAVMNWKTGQVEQHIGKGRQSADSELGPSDFITATGITLDREGNNYLTDMFSGKVLVFNRRGEFVRTISRRGDQAGELMRPKGIAVDLAGRCWVVDAGPAEAVKIYNEKGEFLMYLGTSGNEAGKMNLPAKIALDYDHLQLFRKYAAPGAELEFLVLVTNQYGPHKVSVYGFGKFPGQADRGFAPPAAADPANQSPKK